ncbi:hypothetical protein FACS189472_09230 [Alphaproteobacteria bacterium]|nr:hypothetical protein FACS189472_09230 [Alphaproteobacteria bacterium]
MKKVIVVLGVIGAIALPSVNAMKEKRADNQSIKAANIVIPLNYEYEVQNGLIGLNRDVLLRLMLKLGPDKLKNVIGMAVEIYFWKSHDFFQGDCKKEIFANLMKAGISQYLQKWPAHTLEVMGSLHSLTYKNFSPEDNPFKEGSTVSKLLVVSNGAKMVDNTRAFWLSFLNSTFARPYTYGVLCVLFPMIPKNYYRELLQLIIKANATLKLDEKRKAEYNAIGSIADLVAGDYFKNAYDPYLSVEMAHFFRVNFDLFKETFRKILDLDSPSPFSYQYVLQQLLYVCADDEDMLRKVVEILLSEHERGSIFCLTTDTDMVPKLSTPVPSEDRRIILPDVMSFLCAHDNLLSSVLEKIDSDNLSRFLKFFADKGIGNDTKPFLKVVEHFIKHSMMIVMLPEKVTNHLCTRSDNLFETVVEMLYQRYKKYHVIQFNWLLDHIIKLPTVSRERLELAVKLATEHNTISTRGVNFLCNTDNAALLDLVLPKAYPKCLEQLLKALDSCRLPKIIKKIADKDVTMKFLSHTADDALFDQVVEEAKKEKNTVFLSNLLNFTVDYDMPVVERCYRLAKRFPEFGVPVPSYALTFICSQAVCSDLPGYLAAVAALKFLANSDEAPSYYANATPDTKPILVKHGFRKKD